MSQRETYPDSAFRQFLWWLSTAEKEIISDCTIDRNRYSIVGFIVLTTWIFATLSWTYFFSTAITDPRIYIPLGAFMGFIILCIDRALIKGIHAGNRNRLTPYLFRGMLALAIGTFLAQPAILYLFDKEIRLQVSLDNEAKKFQKQKGLDTLFAGRIKELNSQKDLLLARQQAEAEQVTQSRDAYIREADGTGGTGKVGIEVIALAKKAEYEKLELAYKELVKDQRPKLEAIDLELADLEKTRKREQASFEDTLNYGFLTRIEALQHLLGSNQALRFRYYLVMAILLLIELMPVIAKSLLPSGAYDEKVSLREAMEKEIALENIRREKDLKEHYNNLALEQDKQVVTEFFDRNRTVRQEKLDHFTDRFRGDKRYSFDTLWDKIKQDLISKQEN